MGMRGGLPHIKCLIVDICCMSFLLFPSLTLLWVKGRERLLNCSCVGSCFRSSSSFWLFFAPNLLPNPMSPTPCHGVLSLLFLRSVVLLARQCKQCKCKDNHMTFGATENYMVLQLLLLLLLTNTQKLQEVLTQLTTDECWRQAV